MSFFDPIGVTPDDVPIVKCPCGSGEVGEPAFDAQGIYLCRVCDHCRDEKLSGYRPEIVDGYDQSDVDEPIEPEE